MEYIQGARKQVKFLILVYWDHKLQPFKIFITVHIYADFKTPVVLRDLPVSFPDNESTCHVAGLRSEVPQNLTRWFPSPHVAKLRSSDRTVMLAVIVTHTEKWGLLANAIVCCNTWPRSEVSLSVVTRDLWEASMLMLVSVVPPDLIVRSPC